PVHGNEALGMVDGCHAHHDGHGVFLELDENDKHCFPFYQFLSSGSERTVSPTCGIIPAPELGRVATSSASAQSACCCDSVISVLFPLTSPRPSCSKVRVIAPRLYVRVTRYTLSTRSGSVWTSVTSTVSFSHSGRWSCLFLTVPPSRATRVALALCPSRMARAEATRGAGYLASAGAVAVRTGTSA